MCARRDPAAVHRAAQRAHRGAVGDHREVRGHPADPYVYSSQFARLENESGTGSINDLLRAGTRLPGWPTSIPAAGAFEVTGEDNGLWIFDAWYLTHRPDNPADPSADQPGKPALPPTTDRALTDEHQITRYVDPSMAHTLRAALSAATGRSLVEPIVAANVEPSPRRHEECHD